ncbi:hypothetical protein LPC08_14940 [Roseomonas sp. OT10]|uniref:hypothetical protein n=1 Tax=Roseomonas cutis TaxID=2897332 RepID=UPI001E4B06B9|nr:hypothetical protein [Roseomonas sp. OT10]UFN47314.1 hypothetical protein LPC08_14940 [Roseomonas sp. OT10]
MPNRPKSWVPLFLEEPALFEQIMAHPSLDRRISAWPGFPDLLVGESLRQIRSPDADALGAMRDLYAFGLANGLPPAARRSAVEAMRAHRDGRRVPALAWATFLALDPDPLVAFGAACGWLDAAPKEALAALDALLSGSGCACRGGVFGALLQRMQPGWSDRMAAWREVLALEEVAVALALPGLSLTVPARRWLEGWLAGLDRARDAVLADLLAQALRQAADTVRDPRRVAEALLPPLARLRPIRLAAVPAPSPGRGGEAASRR